jgi:hypothetical protein
MGATLGPALGDVRRMLPGAVVDRGRLTPRPGPWLLTDERGRSQVERRRFRAHQARARGSIFDSRTLRDACESRVRVEPMARKPQTSRNSSALVVAGFRRAMPAPRLHRFGGPVDARARALPSVRARPPLGRRPARLPTTLLLPERRRPRSNGAEVDRSRLLTRPRGGRRSVARALPVAGATQSCKPRPRGRGPRRGPVVRTAG